MKGRETGGVVGRTIKNNYKTFRIVISSKLCIVYYRSLRHREKERERKREKKERGKKYLNFNLGISNALAIRRSFFLSVSLY